MLSVLALPVTFELFHFDLDGQFEGGFQLSHYVVDQGYDWLLIARLLRPLSKAFGGVQRFLKEGEEHPLTVIGYIAAVVVFLAAFGLRVALHGNPADLGDQQVAQRWLKRRRQIIRYT